MNVLGILCLLSVLVGCTAQKPIPPEGATGITASETATVFKLNGVEYIVCTTRPLMSYIDVQADWQNSYGCNGGHALIGTSKMTIKAYVTVSDFTPSKGKEVIVTSNFTIDEASDAAKIGTDLVCEYAVGISLYQPITDGSFTVAATETTAVHLRCIVNDTDTVGAEFYIRPQ